MTGFLSLLGSIATIYVVLCGVVWAMQDRFVFPCDLANQGTPAGPEREGIEQFWLPIDDGGRVEAWFIPGTGRSADAPGPAVVFFHGNGALIDYSLDVADLYLARGASVLLPEYRGYGRSGGAPSQDAIVADMIRFCDALAARTEVDPAAIVFHGQSLGGGVAAALSEHRRPAAIVLQSAFVNLTSMFGRYGVPSFLVSNPFRNDRALARAGIPTLILHGADDEVIPIHHGRRLHEVIIGSHLVVLPGGHNDQPHDWAEFDHTVAEFLQACGVFAPRLPAASR